MPRKSNVDSDNETALDEAAQLQKRSLESLERARINAAQTQDVGSSTLAGLNDQRLQLVKVKQEHDRLSRGLAKTKKLENKLGFLTFDLGGKRAAKKHAALEIKNEKEFLKCKEQHSLVPKLATSKSKTAHSTAGIPSKQPMGRGLLRRKEKPVSHAVKRDYLLDGVSKEHEYRKELEQLNETDKEINAGLDALGTQLDALVSMSDMMGEEARAQQQMITKTAQQAEENKEAQAIAGKRLERFFTRGRRKQKDQASKASMLGALARGSTKVAKVGVDC